MTVTYTYDVLGMTFDLSCELLVRWDKEQEHNAYRLEVLKFFEENLKELRSA